MKPKLSNPNPASAIALFVVLLLAPSAAKAQSEAERLESYRKQAWLLLEKGSHESAVEAFRKVREQEATPTFSAALGQAMALNRTGRFTQARRLAVYAMGLAQGSGETATARVELGLAAYKKGRAGKKGLHQAEASFRRALESAPDAVPEARYLLGLVLLKLERDDEGVAWMRQYLEILPDGDQADLAREYLEDPSRARTTFVPLFEAQTLDGKMVSSESLHGKVVLFDFWGTWCEPCRAAIPHLRELAEANEDEPFVLVGIANDTSARTLRDFLRDRNMDWPQIHDPGRRLTAGAFGVASFPTYILVDHEGVIVFRRSAWSKKVGSKISSEVKKAIEKAKQARR